jgi:hypothetical protein
VLVEAAPELRYNPPLEVEDMKLADKIRALLRSKVTPSPARPRTTAPRQRPGPVARAALPIDPGAGWGFVLKPADAAAGVLDELVEQLALEAYLNGPDFRFGHEELISRVLAAIDRAVARGEVVREEEAPGGGTGRESWISAQQDRIDLLVAWWHSQGGPDVEARML